MPAKDLQHEGKISGVPRHGAVSAQRQIRARGHIPRDQTDRWAKTIDVGPRGRVPQAAHHVRAVGDRQHARSDGDRCSARRTAAGSALIIGVQRPPKDVVESLRPNAKFGRIGLSDDDRTGIFQTSGQPIVVHRHMVGHCR